MTSENESENEMQDESISSIELDHSNGGNQLPNVEEYKVQAAAAVGKRPLSKISRKRRARVILIVASFVIVAVICIAIGVSIGKNGSNSSSSPVKGLDQDDSGPSGGVATNPPGESSSRLDGIAELVSSLQWSSAEAVQTPGTPQHHASIWLADEDPMGIEIKDSVEFRQRYVLAVIYYSLKKEHQSWYPNQALPWFDEKPVCSWTTSFPSSQGVDVQMGVLCHGGSVVKELRLPNSGASGAIPDEIVLLYDLEGLFLDDNDLKSPLNPKLGTMANLKHLGLSSNSFEGEFPSFLGSMHLSTLDFSHNTISGSLPSISSWSTLKSLDLSYNEIEDDISKFSGLANIQQLYLASNSFIGKLSSSLLSQWTSIEALDVSNNKIEGELPENLFDMNNLVILDLHSNYFSGSIPTLVADHSALELLALYDNKLSGKIDVIANKLTNLKHLDLSNNGFSGIMPSFELLEELRYLYLLNTTNFEGGPIPPSIGQLPLLLDVSLQHSRRTGTIPTALGDLKKLVLLDLANNELTGPIPEDLGGATSLAFLLLSQNQLNGTIPDSLSKLQNLEAVLVERNELVGPTGQICEEKPPLFKDFIADCDEISCSLSCCTVCCEDGDTSSNTTCNAADWNAQVDPSRDTNYQRTDYQFNNKGIIFPLQPGNQTTDDNWDLWGSRS